MGEFWRNKKVFLTGHTGFKGSWLSLWLQLLGAEVFGYSLEPPTTPSLFEVAHVANGMNSIIGNILNLSSLQEKIQMSRPDIIIHMAAQSLVRSSYQFPLDTFSTNIIGTANVLEAARYVDSVKAIICVTSDKCYENKEWVWGYRETDPMGGYDPYSCSKGSAELVIASYQRSFFSTDNTANIASVRAGNVLGGGDWAMDRIVPDCIRSITQTEPILIRNPNAIRPWQHVLEPLAGYMILAEKLWEKGKDYSGGWNFGPNDQHNVSVETLVNGLCYYWGNEANWVVEGNEQLHEANYLKLDSSKSRHYLAWQPLLSLQDTILMTVEWYKKFYEGEDPRKITLEQITNYKTLY